MSGEMGIFDDGGVCREFGGCGKGALVALVENADAPGITLVTSCGEATENRRWAECVIRSGWTAMERRPIQGVRGGEKEKFGSRVVRKWKDGRLQDRRRYGFCCRNLMRGIGVDSGWREWIQERAKQ
jgi:hypothetical protein